MDVSCAFYAGEIHAVLGENGAGKSTLMGILGGFVTPDAGSIEGLAGPWPLGRPFETKQRGLAMVHQHFTLVPEFTVAENLALAHLGALGGVLDVLRLAESALQLAKELRWEMHPQSKARNLPVGVQQRIEILKALASDPQILVLDEPTAVLTPNEVEDLFRVLRNLRDRGKAVLLIAHKLSEVVAVADRVTVLRRGALVASVPLAATDAGQLAEWMVGEPPGAIASSAGASSGEGLVVRELAVLGDRGQPSVRGVSFAIDRGEILGIGGVDGNGQVELAEALAGVRKPQSGSVTFAGSHEVAYIPQDRRGDGLALDMSVADNLLIVGHRNPDLAWGPFLRRALVGAWVRDLIQRFEIKAGSSEDPVKSLSGGNQQKVVVSRALDRLPDLLVAVNPTRGLDWKATEYVHRQILAARDAGAAVALISTDLDELSKLATRTVFLSRGQIVEGALAGLTGGVV